MKSVRILVISSCEFEKSPRFRRMSVRLEFVRNSTLQRIQYFTALRASNSAEMGIRIRTGNGSSSGPPTHLGTHFRQNSEIIAFIRNAHSQRSPPGNLASPWTEASTLRRSASALRTCEQASGTCASLELPGTLEWSKWTSAVQGTGVSSFGLS